MIELTNTNTNTNTVFGSGVVERDCGCQVSSQPTIGETKTITNTNTVFDRELVERDSSRQVSSEPTNGKTILHLTTIQVKCQPMLLHNVFHNVAQGTLSMLTSMTYQNQIQSL